jgi:hypothetical protein
MPRSLGISLSRASRTPILSLAGNSPSNSFTNTFTGFLVSELNDCLPKRIISNFPSGVM